MVQGRKVLSTNVNKKKVALAAKSSSYLETFKDGTVKGRTSDINFSDIYLPQGEGWSNILPCQIEDVSV